MYVGGHTLHGLYIGALQLIIHDSPFLLVSMLCLVAPYVLIPRTESSLVAYSVYM